MTRQLLEKYREIGGWLLFFTVAAVLGLFSQLQSLTGNTEIVRTDLANSYISFGKILTLISITILVVRIVGIFIRKKSLIVTSIFLTPVVGLVLYIGTISMMNKLTAAYGMDSSSTGSVSSLMLISFVRSVIICVVWYLYFAKSQRVAIYFASQDEYDQILAGAGGQSSTSNFQSQSASPTQSEPPKQVEQAVVVEPVKPLVTTEENSTPPTSEILDTMPTQIEFQEEDRNSEENKH